MQGLCHLSRRWHQQFCRSPSYSASHQPCLRRFYHASLTSLARQRSTIRPSPYPKNATAIRQGDLVVREYEQDDENSPNTRRSIDHNQDPFVQEAQQLKSQIQGLEEEIEVLKEGPFGPNSDFMQSLPEEHRVRLLKELEAHGLKYHSLRDVDLTQDSDFDAAPQGLHNQDHHPLSVSMRVSDKHRAWIAEFNKALHQAQDNPHDPLPHRLLWKCYLRCQQKVPAFSSFVNEDVWHFLWRSQIMTYPGTNHIVMLAKHMHLADVDLNHTQVLDYVDALHAAQDTASAIQEWEKETANISQTSGEDNAYKAVATLDSDFASRFWATGVQLYTAVGRPAKAQEIAFKSLHTRPVASPDGQDLMILVDVIRAWAQSQRDDADVKLWSCYMLMKEKASELSNSKILPTEVLGQITSALLKTGHQQMALAVFQDMLASHTGDRSLSKAHFGRQVSKGLSIADGSVANETIINQVGLTTLLALPPRLKNKYFFGSWIKWLIGQDKIDDAALVVELMQELGVKPDARHLNGIIGAWLRDGSSAARIRAEEMAWAMIHARIDLVKSRSPSLPPFQVLSKPFESPISESSPSPYTTPSTLPLFLRRNIPPATIETFSVLLLRYTRSSDVAKSTQITDIMTGPAQIAPNSFILNHWLNLSLRASDLDAMYDRYQTTKSEIAPDLVTFAILWDGCRRNIDRARTARSERFWDPRQLYSEMRSWYTQLPGNKQRVVREDVLAMGEEEDGQSPAPAAQQAQLDDSNTPQQPAGAAGDNPLYTQIIRSFCLHSDLRGTYCALGDLYNLFGLLPNEDTATMILMQIARMAPTAGTGSKSATLPASKPRRPAIKRGVRDQVYRGALGRMASVLKGITEWKAGLALDRVDVDQLGQGENGSSQAGLDILDGSSPRTANLNMASKPEGDDGMLLRSSSAESESKSKATTEKIARELAMPESRLARQVRLDALKTFIILILKRMKDSQGHAITTIVEEMRVAGKGMGLLDIDLDLKEVERRVGEVKGLEGDT